METGDGRQKTGDRTQEIGKGDWDRRLGQESGDRNRRQIEVSKQETANRRQLETGNMRRDTGTGYSKFVLKTGEGI